MVLIEALHGGQKKRVNEPLFTFLLLCMGVVTHWYRLDLVTFYLVLHFVISIAKELSPTFNKRIGNYLEDFGTIRNHYLTDFKIPYYLIWSIKVLTVLFYLYFSSLSPEVMHGLSNLFYSVTYTFVIAGLIDMVISLYIIMYKNHPVYEKVAHICMQCIKGIGSLGALHVSCHIP